jgi:hypothetical protein
MAKERAGYMFHFRGNCHQLSDLAEMPKSDRGADADHDQDLDGDADE